MRISGSLAFTLSCVAVVQSGCNLLPTQKPEANEVTEAAVPEKAEHHFLDKPPEWNKDIEDPYAFVGEAARSARVVEKEVDPWYRNIFMSGEARNIERSLGIVD